MTIRLLILEPDRDLLELFETFFSRLDDFEVRYSSTGEECEALIKAFRPDVLLLEPAMPRGVAESILEMVGGSTDSSVVPVLVLTNRPNWIDHPSINELVIKPESLRNIAKRIRRIVRVD